MKNALASILLLAGTLIASAECRAETDTEEKPGDSVFALPIFFYTTDTGVGYGAAGLFGYRSAPDRESQALFSAMHTTKRQFQSVFKVEHYFPDCRHRIIGEVQYNRFPNQFFGLGNRTPNDDPAAYTPEYTEAELMLDRKLVRDLTLRAGAFFRSQALIERDENNPVQSPALPWGTGRMDGGFLGGFLWDSRDNTPAANRGMLLKIEYTGSLYQDRGRSFNGLTLDFRTFHQPLPDWVSGPMLRAEGIRGDYPFYFLPALGGQERLRGYEDDRFMDRNLVLLQQDLRFPIWWRIGGCVFASAGQVSHDTKGLFLGNFHVSYGGGLRYFIKRETGMVIRADFAFGSDSGGTYISFGEAF
ncbi:MAG: BamA/TamA family outer membrane protein [Candidatus Latescibacterota bacterium]